MPQGHRYPNYRPQTQDPPPTFHHFKKAQVIVSPQVLSVHMLCFSLAVSYPMDSRIDYLKRRMKFVQDFPLLYIAILQTRPVARKRIWPSEREGNLDHKEQKTNGLAVHDSLSTVFMWTINSKKKASTAIRIQTSDLLFVSMGCIYYRLSVLANWHTPTLQPFLQ